VKRNLLPLVVLLSIIVSAYSCKKGIKDPITLDQAAGNWNIHAIRYNIYYGTPEPKDSTIPRIPNTKRFVTFDGVSQIQYCFNSLTTLSGDYKFIGKDSIQINMNNETLTWKIMLLTSTNFNIERTLTDKSAFPGASEVVMYQGFVR